MDAPTDNLLLRVSLTRDQVDGLHVSHVYLVPEDVREDHLCQILLLLVPVEIALFELLTYMGHLAIDPLFLEVAHPTCSEIRDVLNGSDDSQIITCRTVGETSLERQAGELTWVRPLMLLDMVGYRCGFCTLSQLPHAQGRPT